MADERSPAAGSAIRIAVASLTLSAAGFGGIVAYEGYSDSAIIPVKGDVPTEGFGSTTHADGSPVKMGDRITAPQAVQRALQDVSKFEGAIKQCVHVPLAQYEYDAALQISYNIGTGAFCSSTMVAKLNAGDYHGFCDGFLAWDKFHGRALPGLTKRRQSERRLCLGLGADGYAKR